MRRDDLDARGVAGRLFQTQSSAMAKWYTGDATQKGSFWNQAQDYPCDACCGL